jgi:hypothetical protein
MRMAHFIWASIVVCLLIRIWYLKRTRLLPSSVFRREIMYRVEGSQSLAHKRYDFTIYFRGAKETFDVSDPDSPIRAQLMSIAMDWGPRLDEES